jgi:hypothetical protein
LGIEYEVLREQRPMPRLGGARNPSKGGLVPVSACALATSG